MQFKTDFSDSGYQGEGEYNFKVGFYYITGTGSVSSINWSSILVLTISEPDPTPTNTPTPTMVPTATPTIVPTATTGPTKSPTSTPIPSIITPSITLASTISQTENEDNSDTLGEATISGETEVVDTQTPEKTKVLSTKTSKWPGVFMIVGGLLFITCGILYFLWFKQL